MAGGLTATHALAAAGAGACRHCGQLICASWAVTYAGALLHSPRTCIHVGGHAVRAISFLARRCCHAALPPPPLAAGGNQGRLGCCLQASSCSGAAAECVVPPLKGWAGRPRDLQTQHGERVRLHALQRRLKQSQQNIQQVGTVDGRFDSGRLATPRGRVCQRLARPPAPCLLFGAIGAVWQRRQAGCSEGEAPPHAEQGPFILTSEQRPPHPHFRPLRSLLCGVRRVTRVPSRPTSVPRTNPSPSGGAAPLSLSDRACKLRAEALGSARRPLPQVQQRGGASLRPLRPACP